MWRNTHAHTHTYMHAHAHVFVSRLLFVSFVTLGWRHRRRGGQGWLQRGSVAVTGGGRQRKRRHAGVGSEAFVRREPGRGGRVPTGKTYLRCAAAVDCAVVRGGWFWFGTHEVPTRILL